MGVKRIGLALAAVLALSGFTANSAMGAAEETNGFWYKEEAKLASGKANGQAVTCSTEESFFITSTVGASETPLKLKATGVSCPGGKIYNESSKAREESKLKFTGVTVVEPAGCEVSGGTIETEPLSTQVFMEGTKVLQRIAPASGENFAEFEIAGCAIANVYPLTGTVFAETQNVTNVSANACKMGFSISISSLAGGVVKVGGKIGHFLGGIKRVLTGGGNHKVNQT